MRRRKRLMTDYTPEEPPTRGTAKKIWRALEEAGLEPSSLHYNANCWGRGTQDGWGTWACGIRLGDYHCGWDDLTHRAYIRELAAPYTFYWISGDGA